MGALYQLEVRFPGSKFRQVNQYSSLEMAKLAATREQNIKAGDVRIRKITETIVWKCNRRE